MPLTLEKLELRESDFRRISDRIFKHCGINLHNGKKGLVQSRLAKLVRQGPYKSFTEYVDYVLSPAGSKEFYNLVDSISTNLTFFFREKSHFDYLEQVFIPQLIAKKRKTRQPRIRIWSAGCSSGEEPYSLAITMLRLFEDKPGWDIKILATDVSTRILKKAQQGVYDQERLKPLPPQQKQRFFKLSKVDGKKIYTVAPQLQQIIHFRYLNLMEPWPFTGKFDIIFCRNVMIYFDKKTQANLVNRYWDCLHPGGLLCIGHSESLAGTTHKFRYVQPATYIK